jgi:hypothetical protein
MKKIGLNIALFVLLMSCSEPPTPSISLKDRQLIDSLYQIEYELIVDTLDVQCERMQVEQLDQVVDSLLTIRLAEVARQRKRYKKQRER